MELSHVPSPQVVVAAQSKGDFNGAAGLPLCPTTAAAFLAYAGGYPCYRRLTLVEVKDQLGGTANEPLHGEITLRVFDFVI